MNEILTRVFELASTGKLNGTSTDLGSGLRGWISDGSKTSPGPWVWVEADLPEEELRRRLNGDQVPQPVGSGRRGREWSFIVWPLNRLTDHRE